MIDEAGQLSQEDADMADDRSWGDTEQMRVILAQVAETAVAKFVEQTGCVTKEFVMQEDERVLEKIKSWLTRLALGWFVTATPAVFLLGGIYYEQLQANNTAREQGVELDQRALWMNQRMLWELGIESCIRNEEHEDCDPLRYRRSGARENMLLRQGE